MQERIELLEKKHKELFVDGGKPVMVAGPGRINIIGEHVDYAGGFVLPSAVDREILLAATLRKDNKLKFFSLDYNEGFEVDLNNLVFSNEKRWANYLMGVFFVCKEAGYKFTGANIVFGGNIPRGGGMSSSAALEVAVCYALRLLNGLTFSDIELVKLCQKAENRFVGAMCGIMDQFASVMSKKGNLLLIDCRNLEYKLIPVDFAGISIVLADT
ncbi:MAG: galactokinase family protein, partial [Candidatus Firestonebacteria bacterium]